MTSNQLEIMKSIVSILKSTNRVGILDLIQHMIAFNFFDISFGNDNGNLMDFSGSLAVHSYCVYKTLTKLNNSFQVNLDIESIKIVSLLHDICRIDTKNIIPLGHSEKSIFIIQKFISLTDDEIIAINSHMGMCDARCNSYDSFQKAYDTSKLALFLYMADMISSSYIENQPNISQKNILELCSKINM